MSRKCKYNAEALPPPGKESRQISEHSPDTIANNVNLLKHGLQSKNSPTKLKAASKAFKYSADERYATQMVNVGVVALLVRILTEKDGPVENAVGTIGNIACFANFGSHVISSGAVPLLIRLLNCPTNSITIKEHAAGALGNLAVSDADRQYLFDCGAIPSLTSIITNDTLTSSCDSLIENTAWAISCLVSYPPQCVVALYHAGAISPLVRLLSSPYLATQAYSAQILCHMSHSYVFRENIVDTGVLPTLVKLLSSTALSTRCYSAGVISNLAWSHAIRNLLMTPESSGNQLLYSLVAIVREGLDAPRTSLLSQGGARKTTEITSKSASGRNPNLRSNRDGDEENTSEIDNEDLMRMQKKVQIQLQATQNACQAISNIALSDSYRDQIVLCGGLELLVECLLLEDCESGEESKLPLITDTLSHTALDEHSTNFHDPCRSNAVSYCNIHSAAACAVSNIARSFHIMDRLQQCGAVSALVQLLRAATTGQSGADKAVVGTEIHDLGMVSTVGQSQVRTGGGAGFVGSKCTAEIEYCVEAIGNLAFTDQLRSILWQENILPLLVWVMDMSTAETASYYSSHQQNPRQVVAEDSIFASSKVLENTIVALSLLSFLPTLRVDLFYCGGGIVNKLVFLLRANWASLRCKEHIAVLLANLATLPSLQEDATACDCVMKALRCVIDDKNSAENRAYDASVEALSLFEAVSARDGGGEESVLEAWRYWIWEQITNVVFPFGRRRAIEL